MAVTVTEVTQIREIDITQEDFVLDGTEVYNVFVDGTDNELADFAAVVPFVLLAVDPVTSLAVPQLGKQLGLLNSFATVINPVVHEEQNKWYRVTVDYTQPEQDSVDIERLQDDPETTTIIYNWSTTNYTEKIWLDAGGIPITMSSGESPTVLPTKQRAVLTCTISRRTTSFDPLVALPLIDAVNDAVLNVQGFPFPIGQAKLIAWRSTLKDARVQKSGVPEVEVEFSDETIVLHFKTDWDLRVFDRGLKEFEDSPANAFIAIKKNGQIIRTPEPLNGSGRRIFKDDGTLDAGNPVVEKVLVPGVSFGVEGKFPLIPGGVVDFRIAMLVFQGSESLDFSVIGIV